MPVNIKWHDNLDDTLHMHVSAPITWEAYHDGIERLIALADDCSCACYMIFTSDTDPPQDNILTHFRRSLRRLEETAALNQIILVIPPSKLPLGHLMVKLVMRLMGLDRDRFIVVDSWESAVEVAA